jgi:hypothetical protein
MIGSILTIQPDVAIIAKEGEKKSSDAAKWSLVV